MSITTKTKIISLANHKGGVGKTSSTINIGAGLSMNKKKVLLIDLDPQANLSLSLGITNPKASIYDLLTQSASINNVKVSCAPNLDLIPSHLDLSGAELELASEGGREFILKELLSSIEGDYDYILIDCPPSIGLLTLNALTASTEVYIPVQAEFLATQGMNKLHEIIEKVKKRLNPTLEIGGVFLTQFDNRKILNKDVASTLKNSFSEKIFETKIRENVAVAEAPVQGVDIFRYQPKSIGAVDYMALTKEILKRHKNSLKLTKV